MQAYLEGIGSLLLDEGLRSSEETDEVRTLAEARTSTVLSRVDGTRKRSVVLFLFKSKLIKREVTLGLGDQIQWGQRPISLLDADLSEANLSEAQLSEADLSESNLRRADLSGDTDLTDAILSNVDLSEANLSEAQLRRADLRGADLEGAYLREANLKEVNLEGAEGVTNQELELVAGSLASTIMPGGSVHD